ncbi:MAG: sigma-54-dependent Fis family transcriptional regulator [Sedimentisphaerales bacterium]|nr:sigma-54-dependent Fis family transcriptional regulator [Sedimentisphaerales bacterium]
MPHVLVVDDKEMMRDSLHATLTRSGHDVTLAESASVALNKLVDATFDVVITDLKMPKMDGLAFIEELRRNNNDVPVIMMTAYATINTAVEAMRKGAFDYIQKPFDADEIVMLVERAYEHRQLVQENEAYRTNVNDWQRGRQLIGTSPAMQKVMEKIALVAQSSATVLICGDSGTGKEMVARAIHAQSPRANKPLLCVNCAALSSNLLESELFGHEKGAFTGADRIRKGRFELAHDGTFLLDEISEMDLRLQAKFLRVLQEREFERVGSSITRRVDVRVLATSNRDLQDWVRRGKFREDLFYRLNVVPIVLPPLRDRLEDIEIFCEYFLQRIADREGSGLRVLSKGALELLRQYSWPGNVRELENLMERVAILADGDVIEAKMIESWLDIDLGGGQKNVGVEMPQSLADMERDLVEKTLERFDGHRQKTAEALGIGVRTLGMKLKRWQTAEAS